MLSAAPVDSASASVRSGVVEGSLPEEPGLHRERAAGCVAEALYQMLRRERAR